MAFRGKVPMHVAISDCQDIFGRLKKVADDRSIVFDPWPVVTRRPHGRTYWGYFRDNRWLIQIGDTDEYTLDIHAQINAETIQRVRTKRTIHRQNAAKTKRLREKEQGA